MRILNNVISWLYILGTIVAGILLITAVTGIDEVKTGLESFIIMQLNSINGVFTGIALICLGIIFIGLRIKTVKEGKTISFDNPEGVVTVSIKAVEEFVKRVGMEFSQVKEMTPVIISARDGLIVRAKAVLTTGTNVPRLAEGIQHTIKNRVQSILGIQNIAKIEIHISKIISKEIKEESSQQTLDIS